MNRSAALPPGESSLRPALPHEPAQGAGTAIPPPPDLADPAAFAAWRRRAGALGVRSDAQLEAILEVGGPLAWARAADLYAHMDDLEGWARAAGRGLLSDDPAVRAYCVASLGSHEVKAAEYCEGREHGDGGAAVIPTLLRALGEVQAVAVRTPLVLEAELWLRYALAEAYGQADGQDRAVEHASEAVVLSKALGLPGASHGARLLLATARFRSGRVAEALEQYEALIGSEGIGRRPLTYARVNRAMIWLAYGDDERALRSLEGAESVEPRAGLVEAARQYIRAAVGRDREEEATCPEMPRDYAFMVRGYRLLVASEGRPSRDDLERLVALAREFVPLSPLLRWAPVWFHAQALLLLGRPVLAAAHARTVPAVPREVFDARALSLSLKLEAGLAYGGEDVVPLTSGAAELASLFDELPTPGARVGLARRLALWHPTAAAFVAHSPASVPELVEVAGGSVFRDGRPITVYGRGVPSRLPFLQATLRAFGFRVEVPRDQSVEEERLGEALRVDHGEGRHRRAVVPPALIVYQLVRACEASDSPWRRAALELAATHGLVPRPQADHFLPERERLERSLRRLIEGELTVRGFRREVPDGAGSS